MSDRSFHFPVSLLIRSAQLMAGGLHEDIGAPVLKRLPAGFVDDLGVQITQVSTEATGQKSAAGKTGQLTKEQNAALAEVKRLTSAARTTAKLAYPDDPVFLHQTFQVGNSDPVGLASVIERAVTVQAACIKCADPLAEHGWIESDTTLFAEAIATLQGADETQETSKGERKATTSAKNTAANKLYAKCQTLQNAVELTYPASRAATDQTVVAARARFLMDTFPPAPGTAAEEVPVDTGQGTNNTPTPAATAA